MTQQVWQEVDQYFTEKLHKEDEVMEGVMKANERANLPSIDVSPNQGKLLHLLVKMKGAKRILEIGTLGGYSSIWMARALPEDGTLTTLEYSGKHAEVAKENMKAAGMDDKVTVLTGAALDTLPQLKGQAFDFIFIDADKKNNPHYIKWAIELSSPGAVIITDNVVRGGKVTDTSIHDEDVRGVREFTDILSKEERIDSTAVQTVGSKGYDGFILGIVKG
ncbi:O-methyltransferase [Rossellomorea aquimaris]|uniref:O-methyltransferase n=1 Tax=Rossellomorea aquimaris TaxID=189382 RepID=UPI001CD4C3CC|nr:O-methyltransferase [Rossellomorea aquimaris]MCA1053778.1 O-methyltransferase [Rossellomorea aquimaris]